MRRVSAARRAAVRNLRIVMVCERRLKGSGGADNAESWESLQLFEPGGDVRNNSFALVIEEKEMIALGVEPACDLSGMGETGGEFFNVLGL